MSHAEPYVIAISDKKVHTSGTLLGWAPITSATYDVDYTLEYLTTGDLAGSTVLKVLNAAAELSALVLIGFESMLLAARRRTESVAARCLIQ